MAGTSALRNRSGSAQSRRFQASQRQLKGQRRSSQSNPVSSVLLLSLTPALQTPSLRLKIFPCGAADFAAPR